MTGDTRIHTSSDAGFPPPPCMESVTSTKPFHADVSRTTSRASIASSTRS
jgi:hypothetical protein